MSSPQTGREWRTSPAEYVHRATSSMPARLKPQKPETLQLIASQESWCTGKDSNLRTSLGGTDLQSVGFNHSPTCAKPPTLRFLTESTCFQRQGNTRGVNLQASLTSQKNRNRANTLAHGNHYTSEKFLNGVRL